MNRISLAMAVALSAAGLFAQDAPKPACAPGRDGPHGARPPLRPNSGVWVARMLSKPGVIEKIGVTDEASKAKIASGLAELDAKGAELETSIRRLSLEQAELFKAVLSDKAADTAPLYAKIDEIAELRTKQGKLAVEALVLLRDCLSQEQIDKAVKIVEERSKGRFEKRGPSPFDFKDGDGPRKMRKGRERRGGDREAKRLECSPECRREDGGPRRGKWKKAMPPTSDAAPGADAGEVAPPDAED